MKSNPRFNYLFMALAAVMFLSAQLHAQPSYTGTTALTTAPRFMEAADMVSANANIYTAGTRTNSNGTFDIIIARYNYSGVLISSVTRNLAGFDEVPVKIKVDASGNIYVLSTANASASNRDLWLVKYNSTLTFQWSRTFSISTTSDEAAVDMVVNGTNVFLLGNSTASGSGSNAIVVRYNTSGTLLNQANYQFAANANDEVATGLSFDGTFLYVSGYRNSGTSLDGMILKYNSSLVLQFSSAWSPTTTTNTNDAFNAIVTDGTSIYVAGYTTSSASIPSKEALVARFNKSTGSFLNSVSGSSTVDDEFTHIVLNSSSIYTMGKVSKGSGKFNIVINKYSNLLVAAVSPWPRTYNPGADSYVGFDLDVSLSNSLVLVTGTAFRTSTSGINYTSALTLQYENTGFIIQEYATPNNAGCNTLETSGKAGLFWGINNFDFATCGGHMAWSSTIANSKANRIEIWETVLTPTEPKDDDAVGTTQRVKAADPAENEAFQVFPNPATTELQIRGDRTATDIRIFDLQGKMVLTHPAGANTFTIDINEIQPGQYIIHIDSENGVEVSKFVKL